MALEAESRSVFKLCSSCSSGGRSGRVGIIGGIGASSGMGGGGGGAGPRGGGRVGYSFVGLMVIPLSKEIENGAFENLGRRGARVALS